MRHLRWPTSLRRWHVLIRLPSEMGQTPTLSALDSIFPFRTIFRVNITAVISGCLARAGGCVLDNLY